MEPRSLLGDLWTDAGGGGSANVKDTMEMVEGDGGVKKGLSYGQVTSSSSSEMRSSKSLRGATLGGDRHAKAGNKRPRSPRDSACGRCFRTSHSTAECWHQVVCLRCSGVGHVAARCQMELQPSPRRRRVHIRSKQSGSVGGPPAVGLGGTGFRRLVCVPR